MESSQAGGRCRVSGSGRAREHDVARRTSRANAMLEISASRDYACGPVDGERLCDATTDAVSDDARRRDAERIQQRDDALGVAAQRERS